MKKKLLRTFMLAAALLMGGSAWSDVKVTLYSNNYETATNTSAWTAASYAGTSPELIIGDAPHSKYIKTYNSTGYSGRMTDCWSAFTGADYTSVTRYFVEFDAAFQAGDGQKTRWNQELVVYTNGATFDGKNNGKTFTGENSVNGTKRLLHMSLNASGNTTYNIKTGDITTSATTTSFAATARTWYHFKITVDTDAKTAVTVITDSEDNQVASATTNLDNMTSMLAGGIFVANGSGTNTTSDATSNQGQTWIDNVDVYYMSTVDVANNPTISLTGVNGTERTYTITYSEGETLHYTLPGGSEETASGSTTKVVSTSTSGTLSAYTTYGTATSETVEVTVDAVEVVLNAPTFNRTSNTSITISSNQSNKPCSPAATIYYSYNGSDYAEYTGAITIAADATVSAYATATGYTNSSTASHAVALFPTTSLSEVENVTTKTSTSDWTTQTRGEETVGTKATYSALLLDGTQWGTNVYLSTTAWGIRNSGEWYANTAPYIMMKNMKAGDIIVIRGSYISHPATVNATYMEKYSFGGETAYMVDADGDVEVGLHKSGDMQYLYQIKTYTHNVTGTQIGAFDNSTADRAATSTKVTLKPGESYHYSFKNYNSGGNDRWNNFVLLAYNSSDEEQIAVRADNFEIHAWNNSGCNNNFNWTNFVSKMNGATVDMTVNYSTTNVFTMNATITTNEATPSIWNYSYTSDYSGGISLSGNIKVALSVDHAWLDITEEGMTAVSATIGKNGYTTFASSYPLDLTSAAGVTAYKAAVDGTTVRFTELNQSIPANTGILLEGTADDIVSFAVAESSMAVEGNAFFVNTTGSTFDADDGYTYYGMKKATKAEESIVFAKFTPSSVAIPADKAYLKVSNSGNARLNVVFDDATGISTVESVKAQNDETYNLSGQRVAQPQKGLYIVNGKKVIIK